jgi:hypothetical protein
VDPRRFGDALLSPEGHYNLQVVIRTSVQRSCGLVDFMVHLNQDLARHFGLGPQEVLPPVLAVLMRHLPMPVRDALEGAAFQVVMKAQQAAG